MPFRKNDPNIAPGGKRQGAGRKPDWFKQACLGIIRKASLVRLLGEIAQGSAVQKIKTQDGKESEIKVSAEIRDRLKAMEMLFDRGLGKVPQPLSGEDGGPLTVNVTRYE